MPFFAPRPRRSPVTGLARRPALWTFSVSGSNSKIRPGRWSRSGGSASTAPAAGSWTPSASPGPCAAPLASSGVGAYSSRQRLQISRTRRWARTPISVEVIKAGDAEVEQRVTEAGASLVAGWRAPGAGEGGRDRAVFVAAVADLRDDDDVGVLAQQARSRRRRRCRLRPHATRSKSSKTISVGSSTVTMFTSGSPRRLSTETASWSCRCRWARRRG